MDSLEHQEPYVDVILRHKERAGITAADLGRRLGIEEWRIGRILRNERRMYADELLSLCDYFGISMGELNKERVISEARRGVASVISPKK